MKFEVALNIMKGRKPTHYRIHYEHVEGSMLRAGYFPDIDENILIKSEDIAWDLARRFAEKTYREFVNIYVVDEAFHPVKNYKERMIKNRDIDE